MLDQQKLLDVATQAANVGGDVLMRYWRDGVVINDKTASGGKSYDLVSDADLDSEKAIASLLQRAYPDHEFLVSGRILTMNSWVRRSLMEAPMLNIYGSLILWMGRIITHTRFHISRFRLPTTTEVFLRWVSF